MKSADVDQLQRKGSLNNNNNNNNNINNNNNKLYLSRVTRDSTSTQ